MQAVRHTLGHARRFETTVQSIHAVIAFDGPAGVGIPLGSAPGTGSDTALAADTKGRLDIHNPVFGAFPHGAGWTNRHAPRVFAVETRHEDKRCSGDAARHFGPDPDDLSQPRPAGQVVERLAVHFATQTADALLLILYQVVLAHEQILPSPYRRQSFRIRPEY